MPIIKISLKERGELPMVDSIKAINAATKTKDVKEVILAKEIEETDKQEATKAKKTKEKEKTDNVNVRSSYAYDRITIQNKVKEYIENLKKTHDYPAVIEELTKYLDLFNVDSFMKKYPNITTESQFKTIMYNETIKYL